MTNYLTAALDYLKNTDRERQEPPWPENSEVSFQLSMNFRTAKKMSILISR